MMSLCLLGGRDGEAGGMSRDGLGWLDGWMDEYDSAQNGCDVDGKVGKAMVSMISI